ncbi:MAG: M56 family metallopeptidase [Vicinamibacterales bacterium]
MMFWRLALSIAFAAFALGAVGAALVVGWMTPSVLRRARGTAPARQASIFFRLRIAPTAAAAIWAFAVVLPTFLWFEPRGTMESAGRALTIAALAGLALLIQVLYRIGGAWYATHRLSHKWRRRGRPFQTREALDAIIIDEALPVVAIVGVFRPRLFISERVLRACTAGELSAMIAHESAHVRRRDNLRRLLVRVCADLPPGSWPLYPQWNASTEEAADSAAVARAPELRVDLAHALVRVARLASSGELPAPASAFYLGGDVESRVRRIIDPVEFEAPHPSGCLFGGALGGALAIAAIAAAPALHIALEAAVRLLP